MQGVRFVAKSLILFNICERIYLVAFFRDSMRQVDN